MSFSSLPKELRLYIWQLAYHSQPPRLVELRTEPHNGTHNESIFCPRYSPSLPPTVFNICQEARTEAHYRARKAGHIVRLHNGPLFVIPHEPARCTRDIYFRFEADILYVPLEDKRVKHFDDSPENGLLPHFRRAPDCDASSLRNVAITRVIEAGHRDGSLTNTLKEFPNLSCIYMVVPNNVWWHQGQRTLFVHAAQRIMMMYRCDKHMQLGKFTFTNAEFARLHNGKLEVVPRDTWKDWSELGNDWLLQRDWSMELMAEEAYTKQYD
jgi:hypothetical protein